MQDTLSVYDIKTSVADANGKFDAFEDILRFNPENQTLTLLRGKVGGVYETGPSIPLSCASPPTPYETTYLVHDIVLDNDSNGTAEQAPVTNALNPDTMQLEQHTVAAILTYIPNRNIVVLSNDSDRFAPYTQDIADQRNAQIGQHPDIERFIDGVMASESIAQEGLSGVVTGINSNGITVETDLNGDNETERLYMGLHKNRDGKWEPSVTTLSRMAEYKTIPKTSRI